LKAGVPVANLAGHQQCIAQPPGLMPILSATTDVRV
jgi:hypothetical protein